MTALASYLRHLIVVLLLYVVQKYKLPVDGADAAANAVALGSLGTATWALVKYLPNYAKSLGLLSLIAIGGLGMAVPSCTPAQITAAESIPIHSSVKLPNGTIGYDSATGISVAVDTTSGK